MGLLWTEGGEQRLLCSFPLLVFNEFSYKEADECKRERKREREREKENAVIPEVDSAH